MVITLQAACMLGAAAVYSDDQGTVWPPLENMLSFIYNCAAFQIDVINSIKKTKMIQCVITIEMKSHIILQCTFPNCD